MADERAHFSTTRGESREARAELQPLQSIEHLARPPHPLTPLVGRQAELRSIGELLRTTRLLTLTGEGGIGKTRLAIEASQRVGDAFPEGVIWVPLGGLDDPAAVPHALARGLGIRESPGQRLADRLLARLRDRRLLLVLDSCEHVLASIAVIGELLSQSAGLAVLATSRAPLGLYGERIFPLEPLGLPRAAPRLTGLNLEPGTDLEPSLDLDLDAVSQSSAVQLFVECARAVWPGFALTVDNAPSVVAICQQLAGLPLAIELAAARLRVLPPRGMLQQLRGRGLALLSSAVRDRPQRQQSLRDAIAWSYDLLDPTQQAVFRRLGVFVGGCTVDGAEAVCAAAPGQLLDALEALLSQSLLRQSDALGEGRLSMLEPFRDFALDELRAAGELAQAQERHATYFADLTERLEPDLAGPRQAETLGRLEREHDNCWAALRWAGSGGGRARLEVGLRLAAALWRFWLRWGQPSEGYAWLEAALARPEAAAADATLRARAVHAAGRLARAVLGKECLAAESSAGAGVSPDTRPASGLAAPEMAAPPEVAALPEGARRRGRPRAASPLTPREREVAALVGRGLTNREIAKRLVIGERTVDTHVEHILGRLGLRSRSQVALWADQHGLVHPDE